MNAALRLLLTGVTFALLVASCGQKGPLTLPEKQGSLPLAVSLEAGHSICGGNFPRV